MEIWKEVEGYSNYKISNTGRIWSQYFNKEIFPTQEENGYLRKYGLRGDNGKIKHLLVHRMVAMAFVENPNPQKFTIVNHIDSNRSNNNCNNLEWTDHEGNLRHSENTGRREDMKKNPGKKVEQLTMEGKYIQTFNTLTEAAESIGVGVANISNAISGRTKSSGGYKWKLEG